MRWFVKWPAGPETWAVAFGTKKMSPSDVLSVLQNAGIQQKPEHPWDICWSHKPMWFADESKLKKVRGWRRSRSTHVGSGVRIIKFHGFVKRSPMLNADETPVPLSNMI